MAKLIPADSAWWMENETDAYERFDSWLRGVYANDE
jgi:hypothetical protein